MNQQRYSLDHLREWRERRKLSQDRLAEIAGVGKSTIVRLELQKTQANGVTVERLSEGLGISRDELFTGPPAAQKTTPAVVTSERPRRRGNAKTSAVSA
jgi:transcriptional regulator with XRE-family HTH domain